MSLSEVGLLGIRSWEELNISIDLLLVMGLEQRCWLHLWLLERGLTIRHQAVVVLENSCVVSAVLLFVDAHARALERLGRHMRILIISSRSFLLCL